MAHKGSWSDPGAGAYSSSSGFSDDHDGELSLPELCPHHDQHRHRKAQQQPRRYYSEQIKTSPFRFDEEDEHEEEHPVDFTFKILVLGDSSVGKTCLIWRFCDNAYAEGRSSTVGKHRNE